jgi:hypothetical protein
MTPEEQKVLEEQYRNEEGHIPYYEFVKSTFAWVNDIDLIQTPRDMNLAHIGFGLATEWIEFKNEIADLVETKNQLSATEDPSDYMLAELNKQTLAAQKELGDLCYYIHMMANVSNLILPGINVLFCGSTERDIEKLLDQVKRKIWYKLDVDLSSYVLDAWGYLCIVAKSHFNLPIEFFILQNKAKLMKRYPQGKFTSQDADQKKDIE